MFFSLRVSSQIRRAFRACELPRAIRRDYDRFLGLLDLTPAMAKEVLLIDSLQAAAVGVERAAYEVLRLEYLIATRHTPLGAAPASLTGMFRHAAVACATGARSLAISAGIPMDRFLRDFPPLDAGTSQPSCAMPLAAAA